MDREYYRRTAKLNMNNLLIVVSLLKGWAKEKGVAFEQLFQYAMEEITEKGAAIRDMGMAIRITSRAITKFQNMIDYEAIAIEGRRLASLQEKVVDGENRLKHLLNAFTHRQVKTAHHHDPSLEVKVLLEQITGGHS